MVEVVAFTKIDYVSRKHVVLPKKWYRAREREEPLGGLFSPKKAGSDSASAF